MTEIPPQYKYLKDVFSLAEQSHLSEHTLFDHLIDLIESKKLLFNLLYLMFLTELKALCKFVTKNLKASVIHYSFSTAASVMMFISKKDSILQSVVNY